MSRDDALLLDMLQWCREGQALVAGVAEDQFQHDRSLQLATVYVLQTIGEAARRTSRITRDRHPRIPWDIIGMRHRLVHDYGRVNLTVVWNSIQTSVPDLIDLLENTVGRERD